MQNNQVKREGWQFILLGVLVSLIGWIFEMLVFRVLYGEFSDRGFVTLPLCPIYGITILIIYKLIGTPMKGGLLLSRINRSGARVLLFFCLAALIPSISEIIGGTVIEALSGEVLWSYGQFTYTVGKYACLEVAYLWGILITFFMLLFEPLLNAVKRIPDHIGRRLALSLTALIAFDFIGNLIIRFD